MSDSALLPGRRDGPGTSPREEDDDLQPLRSILFGPVAQQVQALQSRLDDRAARARDVSTVLPQALIQRSEDPELARALTPPVERAITESVRRDPRPLADALFPAIGPAIRKAVAASLAAMVESINRTLEHSFSWKALRWRIESLRTGRPFAEIVLAHTLLYRVEQVFLIHRKTGLLLQHVRAGPAEVEDAQMISAMLTAIRDFVQDSFAVADHESLDAVRVGDLSVWIEQGPTAIVAAVIRGQAPAQLRQTLQNTVEKVHLRFGDALDAFNGDASALDGSRAALEECLESEYRTERGRRARGALVLAIVGLVAVLLAGGWWLRERARWSHYLEALRAEPGLVVISEGRRDGKYFVEGLRDPLARDPAELLAQANLSAERVVHHWEPYQALSAGFVLQRARDVLRPPPGATLELSGTVLTSRGRAPVSWIADASRLAPLVAGVGRYDATPLLDATIQSLVAEIESAMLLFDRGTSRLVPQQEEQLARLAGHLRDLEALAALANRSFRIDVVGHTDTDGGPETNLALSRERARRVLAALPLDTPHLSAQISGVGSAEPLTSGRSEGDKQRNRRVALRVVGNGAASGNGTEP